ncbi:TPA: hypothetical protein ACH3X1_008163 [Trebouxia sp. C0004]
MSMEAASPSVSLLLQSQDATDPSDSGTSTALTQVTNHQVSRCHHEKSVASKQDDPKAMTAKPRKQAKSPTKSTRSRAVKAPKRYGDSP